MRVLEPLVDNRWRLGGVSAISPPDETRFLAFSLLVIDYVKPSRACCVDVATDLCFSIPRKRSFYSRTLESAGQRFGVWSYLQILMVSIGLMIDSAFRKAEPIKTNEDPQVPQISELTPATVDDGSHGKHPPARLCVDALSTFWPSRTVGDSFFDAYRGVKTSRTDTIATSSLGLMEAPGVKALRKRRMQQILVFCNLCRQRHVKCDGSRPVFRQLRLQSACSILKLMTKHHTHVSSV